MKIYFLFAFLLLFCATHSIAATEEEDVKAGDEVVVPARHFLFKLITPEEAQAFLGFAGAQYPHILWAQTPFLLACPRFVRQMQEVAKESGDLDSMHFEDANGNVITARDVLTKGLPMLVEGIIGSLPIERLEHTKHSYIKPQETAQLVLLQKMTEVLVYYLVEKEGCALECGQLLVAEDETKESWFIYIQSQWGYLPILWRVSKEASKQTHLVDVSPYRIVDNRPCVGVDVEKTDSRKFLLVWNTTEKRLERERGMVLTLVPGVGQWNEHIDGCWGIYGDSPFGSVRLHSDTGKERSLGEWFLGDHYPKFKEMPKGINGYEQSRWYRNNTHTYFIPFPSLPMDYARVYQWSIEALIKEWDAAEGPEKDFLLQTLCFIGESYRLSERKEPRPEGVSDSDWHKRQRNAEKRKTALGARIAKQKLLFVRDDLYTFPENLEVLAEVNRVLLGATAFEGLTESDINQWRPVVYFMTKAFKGLTAKVLDPTAEWHRSLSDFKEVVLKEQGVLVETLESRPAMLVKTALRPLDLFAIR